MGHPLDDTVAGLVAAWSGKPSLTYDMDGVPTQLLVFDGPGLGDQEGRRFLFVGTGGQFVLAGGQSSSGYGYGGRRTDAVQVTCELNVWSGNTDLSAVRGQACGVLEELERLLAADRSLDSRVDRAEIAGHVYRPLQGDQGCGVVVEIAVRAVATRFEEG